MTKPTIGFIGLGLMGSSMVEHMQDLGYPMAVMANRSRTHVDAAIARGATEAGTARELATMSDIVMLCVDTSATVEAIMLGDDGVIAGLKAGAVVIDFGTSLPASTRKLGEVVLEAGGTLLDSPIGRTPAHARDGLLNLMVSGDKSAYENVLPVLQDIGENVFHLGQLGSGHTIKLLNNFFGMTTACAMSEVFAIADKAGIDRKQVHDVMSAGPLNSAMMGFVAEFALNGNTEQMAFSIRNATKDVGYYSAMVEQMGIESMIAAGPKQALDKATDTGFGDHMVPEMFRFFGDQYDKKSNNE